MSQFLLYSLIGSIVLTILVNLLPRVFPGASRRASERMQQELEAEDAGPRSRMRVFFPWKLMLFGSIALTLLVNLVLL